MIGARDIRPVLILDREEAQARWDAVNSHNLAKSPFTDFRFNELLASAFGWTLTPVFWGDEMAACFVVRSRGIARDVVVPPFSPYSCVALSDKLEPDRRKELLGRLFEPVSGLPASRTVSLPPALLAFAPDAGPFFKSPKQTYIVASASLEESLPSFSEGTRRQFQKGDLLYEFTTEPESVEELCKWVVSGYSHHGRTAPLSASKMCDLAESVRTLDLAEFVGVTNKSTGELEAAILLLSTQDVAWYWLAGSVRGPAMTVLIARTLDHLARKGIRQFDLMGANTEGITEFKRRFGGDLVSYVHIQRVDWRNQLASGLGRLKRLLTSRGQQS